MEFLLKPSLTLFMDSRNNAVKENLPPWSLNLQTVFWLKPGKTTLKTSEDVSKPFKRCLKMFKNVFKTMLGS